MTTKRKEYVPFANEFAAIAREAASKATFGDRNVALLCQDQQIRCVLALALTEWSEHQGWSCFERKPGRFGMRRGEVVICSPSNLPAGTYEVLVVSRTETTNDV